MSSIPPLLSVRSSSRVSAESTIEAFTSDHTTAMVVGSESPQRDLLRTSSIHREGHKVSPESFSRDLAPPQPRHHVAREKSGNPTASMRRAAPTITRSVAEFSVHSWCCYYGERDSADGAIPGVLTVRRVTTTYEPHFWRIMFIPEEFTQAEDTKDAAAQCHFACNMQQVDTVTLQGIDDNDPLTNAKCRPDGVSEPLVLCISTIGVWSRSKSGCSFAPASDVASTAETEAAVSLETHLFTELENPREVSHQLATLLVDDQLAHEENRTASSASMSVSARQFDSASPASGRIPLPCPGATTNWRLASEDSSLRAGDGGRIEVGHSTVSHEELLHDIPMRLLEIISIGNVLDDSAKTAPSSPFDDDMIEEEKRVAACIAKRSGPAVQFLDPSWRTKEYGEVRRCAVAVNVGELPTSEVSIYVASTAHSVDVQGLGGANDDIVDWFTLPASKVMKAGHPLCSDQGSAVLSPTRGNSNVLSVDAFRMTVVRVVVSRQILEACRGRVVLECVCGGSSFIVVDRIVLVKK